MSAASRRPGRLTSAGDLSALIEAIARGARYAATSTTPTVFCPATGCTFRHPGTAKTTRHRRRAGAGRRTGRRRHRRRPGAAGSADRVAHPGGAQRQPLGRPGNRRTASEAARLLAIERGGEGRGRSDVLYAARRNAALLTGADPTGAALAHCYRWPGSLNRKSPDHPGRLHRRPHQPRRRNPSDRRCGATGRGGGRRGIERHDATRATARTRAGASFRPIPRWSPPRWPHSQPGRALQRVGAHGLRGGRRYRRHRLRHPAQLVGQVIEAR